MPQRLRSLFLPPPFIAFGILTIGIVLSLLVYQSVKQQTLDAAKLKFDKLVTDSVQNVNERMRYYQSVMLGARGLFEASTNVTRQEWDKYLIATNLFLDYRGITGIGFAPKIMDADRAAYEAARSKELEKKFAIFPIGKRKYYFPLHFTGNEEERPERIWGFDTTSEPNRKEAILRSIATNRPAVTTPIHLVEDSKDIISVAMYVPVHAPLVGPVSSSEDNVYSEHVVGLITTVFRLEELMQQVIGKQDYFTLAVYDGPREAGNVLLPIDGRLLQKNADRKVFHSSREIAVAGRKWHIEFVSLPAFVSFTESSKPLTFLISSLVVSFLAALLAWVLLASRLRTALSERRFKQITEKSNDITLVLNEYYQCTYMSESSQQVLQLPHSDASQVNLLNYLGDDDRHTLRAQLHKAFKQAERALALQPFSVQLSDDKKIDLDGTITFTRSIPDLGCYVVNCRDVSTIKGLEVKLQRMAMYDNLTGLANRKLLMDRLNLALDSVKSQPTTRALLYIDLDNFKQVNDHLGHDAGDQLLKVIARRLRNAVRATDTVARVGGDEFNILIENMTSMDDARRVAQHVVESVSQPVPMFDTEVFPSCSVGLAAIDEVFGDAEEVIRAADLAMYEMKRAGKSGVVEYTENMSASQRQDMAQLDLIRKGLENKEFILHYQPKFSINDQRISGLEALVRWQDHRGNLLAPIEFVPLCERYHLINELGDYVLEQGIKQHAEFLRQGLNIPLSINVAVTQITSGKLHEKLKVLLETHKVDPALIELEITESMLIDNVDEMAMALKRVKTLGVKLAIDDFGAGFSGLNHLKSLPIDVVKIDSSYVNDIPDDPADTEIVSAVITMSHALNLTVVAEGVETQSQLACLQELGCDYGQGFLFSRAQSPEAIINNYRNLRIVAN